MAIQRPRSPLRQTQVAPYPGAGARVVNASIDRALNRGYEEEEGEEGIVTPGPTSVINRPGVTAPGVGTAPPTVGTPPPGWSRPLSTPPPTNVPPHPWWSDKPVRHWHPAQHPQRFRETLALGRDLGLKWHLASGGIGTLSDAEENALFDEVARAISDVGPDAVALFEVCNEIGGTGDPDDRDPRELERLCERVRRAHPQLLYSLTAAAGADEERETIRAYTLPWMQHYYYHPLRGGHLWDKLRHAFSMGYDGESPPVRRLGWAGEPWGNGRLVSVTAFKEELDGGAMALGAAMATLARQAWMQMGYGSVVLTDDGRVTGPGFWETPALIARLPRDLATFRILSHSGESKRGQRIWVARGNCRSDYAIHDDGRFVAINYGPAEERPGTLTQERATREVEVLLEHPMGRVLQGRLA